MQDRLMADAAEVAESPVPLVTDGVVAAALGRLDERDREVLLLTAWEGLGHADAARVLGIRTGTVTVRLHRARRRFARLLAEAEAEARGEDETSTTAQVEAL